MLQLFLGPWAEARLVPQPSQFDRGQTEREKGAGEKKRECEEDFISTPFMAK